ncbi:hypothetical protein CHARACLAT_022609 [Characodon lateralis]|uniref:Death domain-containing protein n=1 Tax=Characodon lateralis TaxID=208331 RepID=A0ABU7DJE2_9TELE|nr:hypothetical protein [Characodon lateralis]
MDVSLQKLSLCLIIGLKLTFLTVTCYNGAIALCRKKSEKNLSEVPLVSFKSGLSFIVVCNPKKTIEDKKTLQEYSMCSILHSTGSPTREQETVAEDIGIHQLERLVEQLTSKECEDLLLALSRPEEEIFQHIDRLSPENNQLDVKLRAKRDTSSAADQNSQCRTALTDWLLVFGQKIYYNRLSRALQHIGRTDIALVEDWGHTLNNWTCC